jgi:hypothetical protein
MARVRLRRRRRGNGEGARVWLVPDGFIPARSTGALTSHEAICILNSSEREASLSLSFYFEDRAPIKHVQVSVPPERTHHIRTDVPEQIAGTVIPKGVPYAVRIESDVPVTVQHSRLDTSQEALALMTSIAYPAKVG